jgi:hypothetical protein
MKPRALRLALVTLAASAGGALCSAGALASPAATIPEGPPPTPGASAERPVGARPVAARTVAEILADVIKAMGGEAAWKAHKTMREKLELTINGLGISGTGERFATSDDKVLLVTTLPGIGTTREGSNGKVLWSEDPINGLRTLSGGEAELARVESVWAPELRLATLFKTIDATTEVGPGGAPLECLVLTPRAGKPITNCYDAKTHLQVTQKGSHPTPQGDTPFSSTVKDYREVGGLKMPFALETTTGPVSFSLRVSEVKLDEPLDDQMFEPPAGASKAAKRSAKASKKTPAKKPGAKAK